MAYDKYKTGFSNQFVEEASMEEIFEQTDVLSLHIPLTDETRYLVTNDYIKQFKKDIFLINTSRGEIASIQCIVKGLNTGKLKGACLDVLENEKMNKLSPEQEILYEVLFQMKNVILTPHVAGWTAESYEKINQVLFEKIKLSLAQA